MTSTWKINVQELRPLLLWNPLAKLLVHSLLVSRCQNSKIKEKLGTILGVTKIKSLFPSLVPMNVWPTEMPKHCTEQMENGQKQLRLKRGLLTSLTTAYLHLTEPEWMGNHKKAASEKEQTLLMSKDEIKSPYLWWLSLARDLPTKLLAILSLRKLHTLVSISSVISGTRTTPTTLARVLPTGSITTARLTTTKRQKLSRLWMRSQATSPLSAIVDSSKNLNNLLYFHI